MKLNYFSADSAVSIFEEILKIFDVETVFNDSCFLEINSILSFQGMNTASRTRNEHSANAFLWFRFDYTKWQSLLAIWAVSGCAKSTNTCGGSVDENNNYLWDGENVHFCKWAQWYQILLLELKSILNVIALHQFIYCVMNRWNSIFFELHQLLL